MRTDFTRDACVSWAGYAQYVCLFIVNIAPLHQRLRYVTTQLDFVSEESYQLGAHA